MENLKVTLSLASPLCLDRNTTLDSILLSCYYNYLSKNGKNVPFDKEHKSVKFIYRQDQIFSGSVWYIDNKLDVLLDFQTIIKKQEYKKIFETTRQKANGNALFKPAMVQLETIRVNEIYFYIRGEKEVIEQLLNSQLKFIGKKASLGLGKVSKIKVESIDSDKGFFLDDDKKIVSKPLDCKYFDVASNSVAFFRNMPPYWLEEDLTPCYMPSNILVEEFVRAEDIKKYNALKDIDYISGCRFIHENLDKNIKYNSLDYSKVTKTAVDIKVCEDNSELKCAFTKEITPNGIITEAKEYLKNTRKSFADYNYVQDTGFISNEALFCLENIKQLGNTLIQKNSLEYMQGKLADEKKRLKHYIVNPTMFKAPFLLNIKDTANSQHVAFKSRVNISNGYFFMQYGNERISVDSQTLERAMFEIKEITTSNKEISKTHLCGDYRNFFFPEQQMTKEKTNNLEIILTFQKKYSSEIRKILSLVAY